MYAIDTQMDMAVMGKKIGKSILISIGAIIAVCLVLVIVVSGGMGDSENISEAEAMYRWLTDKGIDESRIYKEEKSTDTDENIRFSKEVIKEKGFTRPFSL